MNKAIAVILLSTMIFFSTPIAFSHCEVPCGIYNDQMRFTMIEEHSATIEKAMKQITELSNQDPQNMNQVVRWIMNKEKHAEEIQHIISQYFMTQRLKPVNQKDKESFKAYLEKLILCHEILVGAMKTKQTTDLANVEKLRSLVKDFKISYLGNKQKSHTH